MSLLQKAASPEILNDSWKSMSQEIIIYQKEITGRIFTFRDIQVMIDRDLAEIYGVETKRLNEQIRRNMNRFPDRFRFQLTDSEKNELVANCDRFKSLKHATVNPYVFTEQGVAMLSAVLHSETAVKVSIQIMQAFVEMRKTLNANKLLLHRMDSIERKQLEADHKFEQIFKALENRDGLPDTGIFFDGQVFDAWIFASDLMKSAKKNIILIDNYVDEVTLNLLAKKQIGVKVDIYTKTIGKQLQTDANKFNAQYGHLTLHVFEKSHDRFVMIDNSEVYHFGASLKDLGKKWFAFSKMDKDALKIFDKLGDDGTVEK